MFFSKIFYFAIAVDRNDFFVCFLLKKVMLYVVLHNGRCVMTFCIDAP